MFLFSNIILRGLKKAISIFFEIRTASKSKVIYYPLKPSIGGVSINGTKCERCLHFKGFTFWSSNRK